MNLLNSEKLNSIFYLLILFFQFKTNMLEESSNNITPCPGNQSNIPPSKRYTLNLNETLTEMRAQRFSNRIVINITQCQSFGSIIDITKDDNIDCVNPDAEIYLTFRFLLGMTDNMYKVIAKKIGQTIFKEVNIPILLTLALKEKTPEMFKAIMGSLDQIDVVKSSV